MKDIFLIKICLFFAFLPLFCHLKFASLNPLIDIGTDIYCQHDEKNETIFPVKKSGNKYTKVFKIIIPSITASKMWLKNGTLVDCNINPSIGATNKNDYIPVKEGEQYFFRIFGLDTNGSTPILFLDENDNYVKDFFKQSYTLSSNGVEVTVPSGAKKMHITFYNTLPFTIQKILNMTDDEIDKLCINESTITEKINNLYMEYTKNPVIFKKINKAYITFTLDGTRGEDDDYIHLFIEKGIPLSYVPNSEQLLQNAFSGKETRLDLIKKLIATGKGEILSLAGLVLTPEDLGNFSKMYNTFIKTKQMYKSFGIETNGIIFRGHGGNRGALKENDILEKWASAFYGYSDHYGVPSKYPQLFIDPAYSHPRKYLFDCKNIEEFKELIDKAINNNNYHVFQLVSGDKNNFENLKIFLDYIKQKEQEGKLTIGNYKDFYEQNAIRMSEIVNNKHTYYVSSDGNSKDGLSKNDPMNIETLKSKIFISGDKVLFKRGDIFYGPLKLNPIILDNTTFVLSSYGDTKKGRPIFTSYKIVNKKESWEKESDNIYRIDLTNPSKFIGLNDTSSDSTRIGFIETKNKTKYYKVKKSISELTELYDYYTNESHLFIRTNGSTPYEELGELKFAPRVRILVVYANTKVEDLHIVGSGYSAINGAGENKNVEIVNNIIEDIGGSYHYDTLDERLGNAITFFGTDVTNLKVHKNIIRNVYDVAFSIQGEKGSGKNVTVAKNIFVFNSQDSEIWETKEAQGIYNYTFEDNISFMQGRGWSYFARPDKYCASHILFWGYGFDNVVEKTNISFNNNYVYNPKRIYFICDQQDTYVLFQKENCIRSDFNHYYLTNDSLIYREQYKFAERNNFIQDYNKDKNSEFILLDEVDPNLVEKFAFSYDYKELRKIFVNDTDNEDEKEIDDEDNEEDEDKSKKDEKGKSESHGFLIAFIVILIVLLLVGGFFFFRYIKKKKATLSIDNLNNYPLV